MIKIHLTEIENKKDEYLQSLGPSIKKRLEILKLALSHLMGANIVLLNISEQLSIAARGIVNQFEGQNLPASDFEHSNYSKTIAGLLSNHTLSKTNGPDLTAVLKCIFDFLDNQSEYYIENILLCPPENLQSFNRKITTTFRLNKEELNVIGLAINYEFSNLSGPIKRFFKKNKVVIVCPYCNAKDADYIKDKNGGQAAIAELDHFYSKEEHPIISCSFFNLVPTDGDCNGPHNKGSFKFTDEFHLNPYIDGFGNDLKFEPIFRFPQKTPICIELKIGSSTPIQKRKKIVGEETSVTENGKLGNANVFSLSSNYNTAPIKEVAGIIYQNIKDTVDGIESLSKFFNKMGTLEDSYLDWYKQTMRTSFIPTEFNNYKYAKLYRDLHDDYFEKNTQQKFDVIRNIINNHGY